MKLGLGHVWTRWLRVECARWTRTRIYKLLLLLCRCKQSEIIGWDTLRWVGIRIESNRAGRENHSFTLVRWTRRQHLQLLLLKFIHLILDWLVHLELMMQRVWRRDRTWHVDWILRIAWEGRLKLGSDRDRPIFALIELYTLVFFVSTALHYVDEAPSLRVMLRWTFTDRRQHAWLAVFVN